MKYVCNICGYVYDEEVENVKFSDLPDSWTCPLCGAAKSDFSPEKNMEQTSSQKTEIKPIVIPDDDMTRLSIGQIAAIFSNLARGCEKQYNSLGHDKFTEMAKYFDNITPTAQESDNADIIALLTDDLNNGYVDLNAAGTDQQDRGALRVKVWGEKVTRIVKSLLERYEKEGDSFLEHTEIWICTVCGFVYVGNEAPKLCPVCKVPEWKFEKITGR